MNYLHTNPPAFFHMKPTPPGIAGSRAKPFISRPFARWAACDFFHPEDPEWHPKKGLFRGSSTNVPHINGGAPPFSASNKISPPAITGLFTPIAFALFTLPLSATSRVTWPPFNRPNYSNSSI